MTTKLLAELENFTDTCGCSLMDGRCATHSAMMAEIHHAWNTGNVITADTLWSLQDGYGSAGYVPDQGYDWSGIRDSSTSAIEAMHAAIHA